MILDGVFLRPIGLAALAALLVLAALYLVKPEPRSIRVPTVRFLKDARRESDERPLRGRLSRDLLFLLQVLIVVALALSLAAPYVTVDRATAASETVVVLDDSASMATQTGSGTRFAAAREAARGAVGGTTTLVTTAPDATVAVAARDAGAARSAIDAATVTDAPGDLRGAISRAATRAGEDATVVVLSDFVDRTGWRSAVRAARAGGATVELRQFGGGETENVGFVEREVSDRTVSLTVQNTGTTAATRTVSLGEQRRSVDLASGDRRTVRFDLPAGGAAASLSPGDGFPTDDAVPVAAPEDAQVDVLLLTNDPNRNLVTALEVMDVASLTVAEPPAAVDPAAHDVAIVGRVDGNRVLDGTIGSIRDIVTSGGGAAVVAQDDLGALDLGPLSPVAAGDVRPDPAVESVADHPLTSDAEFSAPSAALEAELTGGQSLVTYADGSPLLAIGEFAGGRTMYYGYLPEHSSFGEDYRYPLFWKRAILHLADRPAVGALNRETGTRLTVGGGQTVTGPDGRQTTGAATLTRVGYYSAGDRRYGAALLSPAESNVTAPSVREGTSSLPAGRSQGVPMDLTPVALALALALVLGELLYLRRRGEI